MKNVLLVIPGHLGKDVGATVTTPGDALTSLPHLEEERWINLQQAIGFCLAHALGPLKTVLDVRLVVPRLPGLSMYKNGLIRILEAPNDHLYLQERVQLANDLKADLLEIHNNSAPFEANGFETLCFAKEDKDHFTTIPYLICLEIMESVKKNMNCKTREVVTSYDNVQKKQIGRDIYILKNTINNCIITEAGFMSSKKDIQNIDLDLDSYNEQMGASIYLGYESAYKVIMSEKHNITI